VLNQVATFGFDDFFSEYDFSFKTAREFRERYLIEMLKGRPHGQ